MSDIKLLHPKTILFCEVPHIETLAKQKDIDQWWLTYYATHNSLFNGRVIACRSCHISGSGSLRIEWFKTNYAHYMLRVDSKVGIRAARAVYCSVALTSTTGRMTVGQMASRTSTPKRLQLPGGNVELTDSSKLTIESCTQDACRELFEELGIDLKPSQIYLWRVKIGGDFDDVGLIFTNRTPIPEQTINDSFFSHIKNLHEQGVTPEISKLHFINNLKFSDREKSNYVDYLPSVIKELITPLATNHEEL